MKKQVNDVNGFHRSVSMFGGEGRAGGGSFKGAENKNERSKANTR